MNYRLNIGNDEVCSNPTVGRQPRRTVRVAFTARSPATVLPRQNTRYDSFVAIGGQEVVVACRAQLAGSHIFLLTRDRPINRARIRFDQTARAVRCHENNPSVG